MSRNQRGTRQKNEGGYESDHERGKQTNRRLLKKRGGQRKLKPHHKEMGRQGLPRHRCPKKTGEPAMTVDGRLLGFCALKKYYGCVHG